MTIKTLLLVTIACCLSSLSSGCGPGQESADIIWIAKLKVLTDKDIPDLDQWSAIYDDGDVVRIMSIGGAGRGVFLRRYARDISIHPFIGCFTYSSMDPSPGCKLCGSEGAHLLVSPRSGAASHTVFSTYEGKDIPSVAISPKGDSVAFLVSDGKRWVCDRRLYIAKFAKNHDGLSYIRDCGAIEIVVNAAVVANQLFWGSDGKSVFWTNKDRRIGEFDVSSGKVTFHAGNLSELFAVTDDAFIGGRARCPVDDEWDLVWTLVSISRVDGQERVIAEFRGLDFITHAQMVPGTPYLVLNVSIQLTHYKHCAWQSIIIDTSSGALLGRTEFFIDGLIKRKK